MARRIKPQKRHHPYMTLAAANFFLPYAKERGVSKVARGESKSSVTKEGFMQAYARVKGDPKKLVDRMATSRQSWAERRDNFVARHMAQMTLHGEKLWETSGKYKGWPTRRHLGLIMWAMTPDPTTVGRFIVSHAGSSAARRVVKPRTNGLSSRRKAVSATGKTIKVPRAWVNTVLQLADIPFASPYKDYPVNIAFDEPDFPASLKHLATYNPLPITVRVYEGSRVLSSSGSPAHGEWDDATRTLSVARDDEELLLTVQHELAHFIQSIGHRAVSPGYGMRKRKLLDAPTMFGEMNEVEPEIAAMLMSLRRKVEVMYGILRGVRSADDPSFTYLIDEGDRRSLLRYMVNKELNDHLWKFGDPRTTKYATKKYANEASEILDAAEDANRVDLAYNAARLAGSPDPTALAGRLLELDPNRLVGNPRYTSAKRDDPELWERVKAKVTRGTKGGKAGQWSARKAQLAVAEYQRLGGGYLGPKSPRNALAKWTREKWGTKSGKASLKTGERYLPKAAREALTPQEYAETTRAKRAGLRRGEQFTAQPGRIARKTAKYRK